MSQPEEGLIKFQCQWTPGSATTVDLSDFFYWRQVMYQHRLIGFDEAGGYGYGNISVRIEGRVYVSGTQTGGVAELGPEHVCWITGYDIDENRVVCEGPVRASSETLAHLALYEVHPDCAAVIHIHDARRWGEQMHRVPTTPASIEYGTPAMARALQALSFPGPSLAVMGGHPDGLIAFGPDLAACAAAFGL